MCGISGILTSLPGDALGMPHLRRMNALQVHRGPDGEGVLELPGEPRVLLGHRRLAVIDVAGGAQPMRSPCSGAVVVFNGEIYNHRELRGRLETRGHRFATRSDTEVLLHAYEEDGDAFLSSLRGMFAFALWDPARRRLLAARDRLGVKPFVYRHAPDGTFAFASEAKAILSLPGVPREADPEALAMYLALQYVPAPLSAFKGLRRLPPGHRLLLENGRLHVAPYWRLQPEAKLALAPERLDALLRERLEEAVRVRLESEVPLGAFLSGGLDSASVAALMARASARPRTFCMGFEDPAYDERAEARALASALGTEHREEVADSGALALLPALAWHQDEPLADASLVPTWKLAALARRHVTVALAGDGGDELFGGYERHRANLAFDRIPFTLRRSTGWLMAAASPVTERSVLRRLGRFLSTELKDPLERHAYWATRFSRLELESLLTPEARRASNGADPHGWLVQWGRSPGFEALTDRMTAMDLGGYLPGAVLAKMDTASMASALECRSPFLDSRLLAFALSLPPEERLDVWGGKRCLRRAMAPLLPVDTLGRGKRGFAPPVGAWFLGELSSLLEETVLSSRGLGRGLMRPEAVRALAADHRARRAFHGHRLWSLLMLELWFRTWIDPSAFPSSPAA